MHAELSSLTTTVTHARERVTRMTESLHSEHDAELRSVLEEIERGLASTCRRLEQATRLARRGDGPHRG